MTTSDAEQVVVRFVAAWERGDVDELLDFFSEDAVWHAMPMEPAVGKPAIRVLVSAWLQHHAQGDGPRTTPRGRIQRQVSDGKVVMHERTDAASIDGQEVELPVAAVFEIEDGRITAFREYFDMSPFARR
jgi:limonene-1,2-epoxide hydrolase